MNKFKLIGAVIALVALSATANAAIITEAYTGKQSISEGNSYIFAFDMWYENSFPVWDTAPGLKLTTDGEGAFGAWSSASLFIDFYSSDADREWADINFEAWGTGLLGPLFSTSLLNVDGYLIPTSNGTYQYRYDFTSSALNVLDNEGWGAARVGAPVRKGVNNDLGISRVALVVNNGGRAIKVAEPGSLALFGAGLLGLAFVTRRRLLVLKK